MSRFCLLLSVSAMPRGVCWRLVLAECLGDRKLVEVALPPAMEVALLADTWLQQVCYEA